MNTKLTTNHQIPLAFSLNHHQWKIGSLQHLRVSHVYDPSKFWIVINWRELEEFQHNMHLFYNDHYETYQMDLESITVGAICLVYTNETYYRGEVVACPPSDRTDPCVVVHFFDFGITYRTPCDTLFFLDKRFVEQPRMAIRATLPRIRPNHTPTWTAEDARKFSEMVFGGPLIGLVIGKNVKRRLLYIELGELNPLHEKLKQFSDILVEKNIASVACIRDKCGEDLKVKYLYLFPSHENLEQGKMPNEVKHAEFLRNILPPNILYPNYYA